VTPNREWAPCEALFVKLLWPLVWDTVYTWSDSWHCLVAAAADDMMMMMMMILTLHWCVLIDVCICSERDGRVCKDRDDVSRQGTRDVHAVLSLSPQSVWTRWLAGLSVSLSLSVSRCLSVYVFVWLFVCEHKLMLIICSDSVVKVVLLFSSVLCVCLFINTITLEPFEVSSWKFYRSKIWSETWTNSKMAAFCCTVARGVMTALPIGW